MAAEQAIVGITLLSLGFLWYSNELIKKGNGLWGQAFQIVSFLFMLTDFTVMVQFFRAEALFEMEDLVFQSLFTLIFWIMWALIGVWMMSLVGQLFSKMRNPKLETAKGARDG